MFVSGPHRSSFEDVKKFHSEVEDAAVRLEELLLQKKKKIMQAARVNALEVETHEVTMSTVYISNIIIYYNWLYYFSRLSIYDKQY